MCLLVVSSSRKEPKMLHDHLFLYCLQESLLRETKPVARVAAMHGIPKGFKIWPSTAVLFSSMPGLHCQSIG